MDRGVEIIAVIRIIIITITVISIRKLLIGHVEEASVVHIGSPIGGDEPIHSYVKLAAMI